MLVFVMEEQFITFRVLYNSSNTPDVTTFLYHFHHSLVAIASVHCAQLSIEIAEIVFHDFSSSCYFFQQDNPETFQASESKFTFSYLLRKYFWLQNYFTKTWPRETCVQREYNRKENSGEKTIHLDFTPDLLELQMDRWIYITGMQECPERHIHYGKMQPTHLR